MRTGRTGNTDRQGQFSHRHNQGERIVDSGETTGSETVAIVPVRAQTVDFYGDQLPAAQTDDETIYVPLRPICEALGLDWPSQTRRVRRDPVLVGALRWVAIMTTHRGEQRFLALPLKLRLTEPARCAPGGPVT